MGGVSMEDEGGLEAGGGSGEREKGTHSKKDLGTRIS